MKKQQPQTHGVTPSPADCMKEVHDAFAAIGAFVRTTGMFSAIVDEADTTRDGLKKDHNITASILVQAMLTKAFRRAGCEHIAMDGSKVRPGKGLYNMYVRNISAKHITPKMLEYHDGIVAYLKEHCTASELSTVPIGFIDFCAKEEIRLFDKEGKLKHKPTSIFLRHLIAHTDKAMRPDHYVGTTIPSFEDTVAALQGIWTEAVNSSDSHEEAVATAEDETDCIPLEQAFDLAQLNEHAKNDPSVPPYVPVCRGPIISKLHDIIDAQAVFCTPDELNDLRLHVLREMRYALKGAFASMDADIDKLVSSIEIKTKEASEFAELRSKQIDALRQQVKEKRENKDELLKQYGLD